MRESPSVKQLISRAQAACERDEYAAALLDLRGVLARHPDFADVRNQAGFCRAMLGDSEGALEELAHAVELNPDYAEAHLNRALVLNNLSRFDEAREAYARAGAVADPAVDPLPAEVGNRIALGHAELGDLYLAAGEVAEAVDEYAKALGVRPGFVDIRSRLARALLAMGELERAGDELRRVLKDRPSYVDARLHLATVLRRMGRLDEAVTEWMQCLEEEPGNDRALACLVSVGREPDESPSHGDGASGRSAG